MKLTLHLLLTIMASVLLAQAEPTHNLLTNGDFETGVTGAASIGTYPAGFTRGIGSNQVLELIQGARPGSPGKQSLLLAQNEQTRSAGLFSQMIPISDQQGLTVSGWFKPHAADPGMKGIYFGVAWYDAMRKPIVIVPDTSVNYAYIHRRTTQDGWFRLEGVFLPKSQEGGARVAIPTGAAFCQVRVFTLNYQHPFGVDDLEVRQMSIDEARAMISKPPPVAKTKVRRLVPTQPAAIPAGTEYVVAWTGDKAAGEAAMIMSDYMSKVLNKPVIPTVWQPTTAQHVYLITHAAAAPDRFATQLAGKFSDAFVIESGVTYEGRQVTMLVSGDEYACDFPVYYYLTTFMDVHWVGPGELGEVYRQQPDWIPPAVKLMQVPDFAHRLWSGNSFSSREWLARSSRMGFHHALGLIFSPKKHADTPEVYPLVGGKRYIPDPDTEKTSGFQPCTSNPKSVEIATEAVLEQFRNNPKLISASLSVNDGAGNVCECDDCRALDPPGTYESGKRPDLSNRFFTFYNQVTENVRKEFPHAYTAVLGYGPTKQPPTGFKINSHVQVFEVQPTAEKLKAWGEAGAGPNIYLWLWDGGFLTMRPNMQEIAKLVKAGHQYGGIGCYSEIIAHWTISAPKFYVLAGLLWDSSQDADTLLADYTRHAYGPAASDIKALFDRWNTIYDRYPEAERYRTAEGWRDASQLKHVTRDDLTVIRQLLDQAATRELNDKQRERLEHLALWHQLMLINADQYLAAKELGDPTWLASQKPEQIVGEVARTVGFTAAFTTIWDEQVLTDTSGWLLDGSQLRNPQKLWNQCYARLRTSVSSAHETAMDTALAHVAQRLKQEQGDKHARSFFTQQLKQHPDLAPFLQPIIDELSGIKLKNLLANGSFEKGTPGNPPTLDTWEFYEDYGMVKGVKAKYAWEPGSGFDGGRAIAFGEGRYPEMKGIVTLEKDARYRLSFRYKTTTGQTRNPSFWIFTYDGPLATNKEIEKEKIHSFLTITLEPTEGEWKQVQRTFTGVHQGTHVMMIVSYYLKANEWTWWDEVKIERLY